MKWLVAILPLLILFSCESNKGNVEDWKQEIYETELAFSRLSEKEGIKTAFTTFAAEDAVIKRSGKLILGKDSLRHFFEKSKPEVVSEVLTWEPNFVDVSSDGDLGYTYGKFVYIYTDTAGNVIEKEGYFHTVWKKQKDGTWKFVWD